ncbi:Metal-dependent amidase/aminoacylase/carboxypeptidase [Colletotrichum higginsianum IMI 349063]|uniref:Peptidase M20 domain-containing protein 2 n=2 Tax=Colletotrichum higginsianum TaxID=80884 RepID=A0A1B7YCK3_COLHI|nr:Metal-dependent amidase/aminoacylase/carboxypeptidase [Colletotrichum higginsianum IMI 349063]OBR09644.1 Metal-dependent amidase/aminoacylase/carboxypeptidase [Colletotrichum higginsianum IMI 349063]TIC95425.1 Peptidase M20 domain-containing protein 2 [Colletotrichum higginsianum]GJC96286.1 metal-dependent amidase/aminoacylase/carboxypeptidase [Colletotrichum higginsianum]
MSDIRDSIAPQAGKQDAKPAPEALRGALNIDEARSIVNSRVDELDLSLHNEINKLLHNNPETAYKEFIAHESITNYLEKQGFAVKRNTYGLETSFEAEFGSGGRQVVVCAEYDALPDIGHACGHNLIATSSIAAFLGAARALSDLKIPGRLRILGTPAEEGGGGKAKLIDAGAFNPPEDIAAAIMAHPTAAHQGGSGDGSSGLAGFKLIASHKFRVEFRGKPAHAAGEPWKGLNALDAAVAAYSNVALLRQQIQSDERIHGVIEVGGTVPNVITDYTRMNWNVRSPTIDRADALLRRVKACLEAGAAATGCEINYIVAPTYMNLRANDTLCKAYVEDMASIGETIQLHQAKPFNASTDMGNVSHLVPSFHGAFVIPTSPDVAGHHPEFAAAAATDEAHAAALKCAKGMAMLAVRVLTDDLIANRARKDFMTPDES